MTPASRLLDNDGSGVHQTFMCFGAMVLRLGLAAAVFLVITVTGQAAVFGNFTYQVDAGEVIITDFPTSVSGPVVIPAAIAGMPVVRIQGSAFLDCDKITSVTMPDTVRSIGAVAFGNCSALVSITLSSGLVDIGGQAFLYCTALTEIGLPASVMTLGSIPFSGCTGLTAVTVDPGNPNYRSVDGAVYNKALTAMVQCPAGKAGALVVPEGVTAIPAYAVSRAAQLTSISLPSSVTVVGTGSFQLCASLVSINFPAGLTAIPTGAFHGCKNLVAAILPDGVTSIGPAGFQDCASLASIRIPSSVSSIDDTALLGCHSLAEINLIAPNASYVVSQGALYPSDMKKLIRCEVDQTGEFVVPESVTSILPSAFSGCHSFQSVLIPDTQLVIGNDAFSNSRIPKVILPLYHAGRWKLAFTGTTEVDEVVVTPTAGMSALVNGAFSGVTSLKKITVMNGVLQIIGSSAFSGCSSLEEVVLPSDLTTVDRRAFEACTGLTGIVLPSSVVSLGDGVFSGCTALKSFGLPAGFTHIPADCFRGCKALEIIALPHSVQKVMDRAFMNCTALRDLDLGAVTELWESSFGGCTGLEDVAFPQSIATIYHPFTHCGTFRSVTVPTTHAFWASHNLGEGTSVEHMIVVPYGDDRTVMGLGGTDYNRVTLKDGVEVIFQSAFQGCTRLESLTLPSTVERIENSFAGSSVERLVCLGNAPEMDELGFENVLPDFTVYYFDDATGFTSPTWNGVRSVNMGPRTPANVWKARHDFGHATSMDSDPDGDGIKLLMAYALGLDPHRAGVADLPPVEVSGTTLAMTFQSGVPGITYQVETSDDLVDWTDQGVVVSPPDAAQLRTATYAGTDGKRFMRLLVSE